MSPTQRPSCENVIAVADEPHHHLVIDKECVRAYAVEIAPGRTTLCHLHSLPYLLYVAGDAHIVSAPKDEDASEHHYPDGHCEFSPAGLQHVVENVAATTFRNLVFEVLPSAGKLRRAGMPASNSAGVRTTSLYSGEAISGRLVQLTPGAQTQVTGPAVVASPYEDEVELISTEGGTRKLEKFDQLEWIPEGSIGLVRCEAGKSARVIIICVGCE